MENLKLNRKISVAISVFNGEKYIAEQLSSLEEQTLKVDEYVIFNDNSNDNTLKIIQNFKKKSDSDVKIINNLSGTNLGYTGGFNEALRKTTGDIIFLCDSDDYWFKTKIECFISLFDNESIKLVICDALITDQNLNTKNITRMQLFKKNNKLHKFVQGCCCAFTKDFLKISLPIPKEFIGHDSWLNALATILNVKSIYPKVLQYYRLHDHNYSPINQSNFDLRKIISNKFKTQLLVESLNQKKMIEDKINIIKINNPNIFINVRDLDSEIQAIKKRIKFLKKNILLRKYYSTIFFLKGNYKYFNGLKSFIRDFLI